MSVGRNGRPRAWTSLLTSCKVRVASTGALALAGAT